MDIHDGKVGTLGGEENEEEEKRIFWAGNNFGGGRNFGRGAQSVVASFH